MIHGLASRNRYHAPHAEALGDRGAAQAPSLMSARTASGDATGEADAEAAALPVLRLAFAVGLIFAFGALAPVIAAAAR